MGTYFDQVDVLNEAYASIDSGGEMIHTNDVVAVLSSALVESWVPDFFGEGSKDWPIVKSAWQISAFADLLATTYVKDAKQSARSAKADKKFFELVIAYKEGQSTDYDRLVKLGNTWVSAGAENKGMMIQIKNLKAQDVQFKIDDHNNDAAASKLAAEQYEPVALAYIDTLAASNVVKASDIPALGL